MSSNDPNKKKPDLPLDPTGKPTIDCALGQAQDPAREPEPNAPRRSLSEVLAKVYPPKRGDGDSSKPKEKMPSLMESLKQTPRVPRRSEEGIEPRYGPQPFTGISGAEERILQRENREEQERLMGERSRRVNEFMTERVLGEGKGKSGEQGDGEK